MNESKAEIYRYIRDQHDKHVAGRESIISRFGNVRLLAGIILTVFSLSISIGARSLDNAHSDLTRILATLPLIFFAIALYYVTRALVAIPDLIGTIHINFPGTDRTTITRALEADKLDVDQVIEDFSYNYLEVIEKNMNAKYAAGEQLANCVRFIRRGLFATIAFLASTVLVNLALAWVFAKF